MGKFGGETMVIGEAMEKVPSLVGLRVRWKETGEDGTVYLVYINREKGLAQIWTNMDGGGARCFRPHHLDVLDGAENQIAGRKLLAIFGDAR
jgi:hypothetical protein